MINSYTSIFDGLFSFVVMKNIFVIIFTVLSMSFCYFGYVNSLSVADFTPILDKKVASLKTTEQKVKFLESFSKSLWNPKYANGKNGWLYKSLQEYCLNMLNVFEHELMQEQSQNVSNNKTTVVNTSIQNFSKSTKELPHLSDNFPNVDVQSVRNAVLSWHNEERKNVWLGYYTYNLDLEWSAVTWANSLAVSHKTSNLHPRNPWDWYYNYDSMLNRFSGLWISFPKSVNWGASFSETIWRNVFKCNKSDCTQDLIKAIEKTWTWLIIKEKSSNGSHYRAAVMKHFTQMWVWIAIDRENGRYYLVIHYWVNF